MLAVFSPCVTLNIVSFLNQSRLQRSRSFRSDQVKDGNGITAILQEQGTSVGHMICAKALDALASLPDREGQDADARKAYAQAYFSEFEGDTETWVMIDPDQYPDSWQNKDGTCKYRRPYCRLMRNLYGHPLAGLYWEKHCDRAIKACGFKPIQGWECLYYHPTDKMYLSVYVDDFKLAGKKENIPKTWAALKQFLNLDPPTPFHNSVYLGCCQYEYHVTDDEIRIQEDYVF